MSALSKKYQNQDWRIAVQELIDYFNSTNLGGAIELEPELLIVSEPGEIEAPFLLASVQNVGENTGTFMGQNIATGMPSVTLPNLVNGSYTDSIAYDSTDTVFIIIVIRKKAD